MHLWILILTYFYSPLQPAAVKKIPQIQEEEPIKEVLPEGVDDYDLEMKDDPTAVANYASDIFKYYQEREVSSLEEGPVNKSALFIKFLSPLINLISKRILIIFIERYQDTFSSQLTYLLASCFFLFV